MRKIETRLWVFPMKNYKKHYWHNLIEICIRMMSSRLHFMRRCLVISITFVILSSVFTLIHLQARFYSPSFADQTDVSKRFTIDSKHSYGSNSDIYTSNTTLETGKTIICHHKHTISYLIFPNISFLWITPVMFFL